MYAPPVHSMTPNQYSSSKDLLGSSLGMNQSVIGDNESYVHDDEAPVWDGYVKEGPSRDDGDSGLVSHLCAGQIVLPPSPPPGQP